MGDSVRRTVASCCVILFGLALGMSGFSQTTSSQQTQIPDSILYRNLFQSVLAQERFGDRLESQHKTSIYVRALTQKRARLTVSEDQLLKSAAKAWSAKHTAFLQERTRLVRYSTHTPATLAQLRALSAQEESDTLDSITQLKNAFGPTRVPVLDGYLHSYILSHTSYVEGKAASKPAR
jgi:hypothetical protein